MLWWRYHHNISMMSIFIFGAILVKNQKLSYFVEILSSG